MTARKVHPAADRACSQCPWRESNRGKKPAAWYSPKNLRRLWSKLRRGERMTCHPTDPGNPVPKGCDPVPDDARTLECAGSLVLVQREFVRFQESASLREYRAAHPGGLTRDGLAVVADRAFFGMIAVVDEDGPLSDWAGEKMTRPDLNDVDVQHEQQLARWYRREGGAP